MVERAAGFADIIKRDRRIANYTAVREVERVGGTLARYERRAIDDRKIHGPRHVDEWSKRKVSGDDGLSGQIIMVPTQSSRKRFAFGFRTGLRPR